MASENPRAPRHEVATLSEQRELQRSSPGRSSSLTCVFRRQTRPTKGRDRRQNAHGRTQFRAFRPSLP